jgi:hypothetical protein
MSRPARIHFSARRTGRMKLTVAAENPFERIARAFALRGLWSFQ